MLSVSRPLRSLSLTALFAVTLMAGEAVYASCGEIVVAKGDIKVESAKTKAAAAAPQGTKVCQGDTIVAGPQSRAKVKMADGNELNISPDSRIMLEQYEYKPADNKKKVMLNVLYGKVRAATKEENMYNDKAADGQANTFQVKTKSAVAGVRGTDFLTSFDQKTSKSEVVTFKGNVEVGQPGPGGSIRNSVSVTAGQKTEALPGAPPSPPKAVPKGEMDKMNSETKSEASTSGGKSSDSQASSDKKEEKKDEKKDAEKKEEAKRDEPKKEEPKKEEPRKDADKKDEPKRDEAKRDEPKRDEAKRDEPKRDEPKRESGGSGSSSAGSGGPDGGGSAAAGPGGGSGGGSAAGGGKSGGSTAANGGSPGARGPASAAPAGGPPAGGGLPGGGRSMIDAGDLGISPVGGPSMPPMPAVPNFTPPVVTQLPPVPPVCDLCNRTIESGPAKVNVRIIIGN